VLTNAGTRRIPAAGVRLDTDITIPDGARGLVLFADGSGASRHSPRARIVADLLNLYGHGTVLVDLLTPQEKHVDLATAALRSALGPLAGRLVALVDRFAAERPTAGLPIGLSASGAGVAVALFAASVRPRTVRAVVSCGGRTDLAGSVLTRVRAPTLLLAGDRDRLVVNLNQRAALAMPGVRRLQLIGDAGHMLDEPGAREAVARLAAAWFDHYLSGGPGVDAGRPVARLSSAVRPAPR